MGAEINKSLSASNTVEQFADTVESNFKTRISLSGKPAPQKIQRLLPAHSDERSGDGELNPNRTRKVRKSCTKHTKWGGHEFD